MCDYNYLNFLNCNFSLQNPESNEHDYANNKKNNS